MFGQCLVTPTILDSYEFSKNAPHTWKARAENGFLAKLRREKVDYPKWVGKGRVFEDAVYAVCNAHRNQRFEDDPIKTGSQFFRDICAKCIGGTFQDKLKTTIEIDGEKAFFFGYSDVIHPNIIIDLKTTLKWKGEGKYLSGHQHLIYTMITGIEDFEYIVAQWESEDSDKLQAVYTIPYHVEDFDLLTDNVIEKVSEFFAYLRANKLWDDYYTIFSKN